MTQDKQHQQEKPVSGSGRIPEEEKRTSDTAVGTRDISDIDRQEGAMNNGRLGGNFDEDAPQENESGS